MTAKQPSSQLTFILWAVELIFGDNFDVIGVAKLQSQQKP
jgi:hypothetical protein